MEATDFKNTDHDYRDQSRRFYFYLYGKKRRNAVSSFPENAVKNGPGLIDTVNTSCNVSSNCCLIEK